MYYDEVATGLHLKEYTIAELAQSFRDIGFRRILLYAGARGVYVPFPLCLAIAAERVIECFPFKYRSRIARTLPARSLLGIRIIGIK
jgi:hypothetical protein